MPRRLQADSHAVLKYLAEVKRFSVFEATANDTIARTMDRMQGKYFTVCKHSQYPWCEIELTNEGKAFLERT